MDNAIVVRTVVPVFLLMGMGLFARGKNILRAGDERVLNGYIYYFALPALFFVSLSETRFTAENLRFMVAGIVPVPVVVAVYLLLYRLLRFERDTLYLLILTTIFGSLAFFGIPFISFAFPFRQGEQLAALAAASISMVSVAAAIAILEFYKLEQVSVREGLAHVVKRLSHNPLILSILAGVLFSLVNLRLPIFLSKPLHMLGSTTSTVAVFMLGVFLYGRRYGKLRTALKLSLLRMLFLPLVALLSAKLFNIEGLERTTVVLMHSMPMAIAMIVLSERYDFHREIIASLVLISSLSAGIYLNIWLLVLGH